MRKELTSVEKAIRRECDDICELLIQKNRAYGNTALNPPQIFSKLPAREAILARLDDKLSRIKNRGLSDSTEDTAKDIMGYLILYRVIGRLEAEENQQSTNELRLSQEMPDTIG
jgi:hypothetical protein